jgi:hypothetical protein
VNHQSSLLSVQEGFQIQLQRIEGTKGKLKGEKSKRKQSKELFTGFKAQKQTR